MLLVKESGHAHAGNMSGIQYSKTAKGSERKTLLCPKLDCFVFS